MANPLQGIETFEGQKGLGRKTVLGGLQVFGSQGIKFFLQLGSTMVLARLLTPEDFGLVAMVAVVVNFIGLLKDGGLTIATIQSPSINLDQLSALFWINLGLCVLLSALVVMLAPLIAYLYGREELTMLTVALGVIIVFQGSGQQHRALLMRRMNYGKISISEVAAMTVGVVAAIIAAFSGLGYWALVIQIAAGAITSLILYFSFTRWVPGLYRKGTNVRSFMKYGLNLSGFNFVNYFTRNADNFLIGLFWGAGSLGLYSKAYQLLMLPVQQLNGPASKLLVPVLSRYQENPENYRLAYMKGVSTVCGISMPLVGFFFVAANPMILVVLGPQWLDLVPIFIALLPATIVSLLNITTGWVYLSMGTTGRLLKWALFASPVNVLAMIIGLPWGAFGVAIAISCSFVALRVPYWVYTFKNTPLSLMLLWKSLGRPIINTVIAIISTIAITSCLPNQSNDFLHLIILMIVYGLSIAVADFLPPRKLSTHQVFKEALNLVKMSGSRKVGQVAITN